MLFINDEGLARANEKNPIFSLGELVHFSGLIFDEDSDEQGEGASVGFAEHHYDAYAVLLADEDAAERLYDKVSESLHCFEDEMLGKGNEGFVAVYRLDGAYIVIAGDNGGVDITGELLIDEDDDAESVPRCTADRVRERLGI
jgi:hypothetical protein